MPTITTRHRAPRSRRTTPSATHPRRRRSPRRPTPPQRRGLAGGWLQRRQPEPTGLKKVAKTVSTAFSRRGSKVAATGLGLLTAGGIAQYMRGRKTTPSNPSTGERPEGTSNTPPAEC